MRRRSEGWGQGRARPEVETGARHEERTIELGEGEWETEREPGGETKGRMGWRGGSRVRDGVGRGRGSGAAQDSEGELGGGGG